MSLSVETLAVARKYTDDSLAGAGAVAGVPCKIQSITAITGGNRVTFLWTDNNGDDHTSAMDVMNGADGEDGKGIQSVTVNAQDHLIITYTDGTTVDAGEIEIHNAVDSVNGQPGAVVLDAEDVGALPDNTPIPSKTSDLTNDSGFATTSDVSTALADYTTTADLTTLLAAKQDTLTFDNVPTENSNNPVKSGGVYSAERNIYEVMGQNGAKNLLPNIGVSNTINGITYTVNEDGSVTADGTATSNSEFLLIQHNSDIATEFKQNIIGKTLILSGCPDGGGSSKYHVRKWGQGSSGTYYDQGKGVTFTPTLEEYDSYTWNFQIRIMSGITVSNLLFKPMLRLASDTDTTYQPYSKTNQKLTAETQALANQTNDIVNVLGAKNVLPTPYYSTKGGTTTSGTLTVTENADGSVTIDGTASGQSYIDLARNDKFLKAGTYILSGGITSKQYVYINCLNNGTYIKTLASAMTSEVKFVLDYNGYDAITVGISIASGESLSNVTFYPMIRLASDPDDTYVPYAMTNQQLTQDSVTWDDLREVGAVNYLVYPYSETTHTSSNIIYTDNGDGSITVGTGTTSSGSPGSYAIANNTKDIQRLRGKAVKFSIDCDTVVNGSNANVQMAIYDSSNNLLDNHYLHMNGGRDKTILTVPSNADHVYIQSWNKRSTTISTAYTVKPMITPVSYNGPYVPYAKTNRELTEKIDIVGNLFTTTTKVVDNITHGIATTVATLGNLPIGTYVVSGQFNSDSAMSGGGLVQFASSGVIQNGATCSTIINQGFKANAGLTGIFNVTNATNQINLQIYTATADLTVSSARLAAIRIA